MRFSGISILAMLLAITYCIGLIAAACDIPAEQAQQLQYPELSYEELIFDNSMVHIIDVAISEQDWKHLKKDAFSKECLESTVSIDGEKMYHVGVRTKGNSTLLLNSSKGWDRFSLALEFNAFQKSQRFHGLDQLSLYNNMFDPSFMKTYLCYEMMRSLDVASPLCSFAAVYVNGSFVGLYAASEVFSESFALRNFGYDYGNLYKPEQFDIAAIMRGELQNTKINLDAFSGDQAFAIENVFSVSNDAVRLAYLGDTFYDYEDIWRNSTFPIGTSDKKRVIDALRRINENDHPEKAVDIDALARYFAANTFVLNTDCYTTGMAHNYGLYEKDGVLTMLPWDYDVAMGNIGSEFGVSDPSVFINQPIDTPVFSTTVEERPMLRVLLESEEGLALYHQYLNELLEIWIDSGRLQQEIDRLEQMIRPWAELETITVYSMEEHSQAIDSIKKFAAYRAESIRGQLNGAIPSTWEAQQAEPELLPDYSDYCPPESGIMKILCPDLEDGQVSLEALMQVLPEANRNNHESISLPALLNLIDWRQLLSMDRSAFSSAHSSSDINKEDLLIALMPFPIDILKIVLLAIAIPITVAFGLRFARRRRKTKGGVRHVV